MARNPVFAYAGPESPTIPIGIILYDGTRYASRGTFVRKPVTSASASDALALTGVTAWLDLPFDVDPKQIQYVVPDVDGAGLTRSQMYQTVRCQRVHGTTYWTTTEAILVDDPQVVPSGSDFSALEFGSWDFAV